MCIKGIVWVVHSFITLVSLRITLVRKILREFEFTVKCWVYYNVPQVYSKVVLYAKIMEVIFYVLDKSLNVVLHLYS